MFVTLEQPLRKRESGLHSDSMALREIEPFKVQETRMPTSESARGIVNGHWEPRERRSSIQRVLAWINGLKSALQTALHSTTPGAHSYSGARLKSGRAIFR